MERLELAISGAQQALRPAADSPGAPVQAAATGPPPSQQPSWLGAVGQHLPRVAEALGAEQSESGDFSLAARATRLTLERDRLLRQLRQLAGALPDSCLAAGTDPEELRRTLHRLLLDIAHHHQRVNDLVYDEGWRDVGGSE